MTVQHRTERPDIERIMHKDIGWIIADASQQFMETPKTFELWTTGTLMRRIAFWRSSSIFWVVQKESAND